MKQKRMPVRMCLGCQEMKPKMELIRIVKNKDNGISIDFTGKKPGRGAYICKSRTCFEKARKGKRISKAFGSAVGEEVYEILRGQLEDDDER